MPNDQAPVAEAVPGHNRMPVTDLWKQENETLAARLAEDNAPLRKRKEELFAEAAELPVVVENDEHDGELANMIKKLRNLEKDAESIRVGTKAPVLQAGTIIDNLFKNFNKPVADMRDVLTKRLTIYKQKKEAEARKAAEEEARIRREEAEIAAREAAEKAAALKDDTDLVNAIDAQRIADSAAADAQKAQEVASAKPAEFARVRGTEALSTLKEVWKYDITDFAAINPAEIWRYLSKADIEKAIGRAVREGERNLKGIRIYSTTEAAVR